jgi:hypothetical protein
VSSGHRLRRRIQSRTTVGYKKRVGLLRHQEPFPDGHSQVGSVNAGWADVNTRPEPSNCLPRTITRELAIEAIAVLYYTEPDVRPKEHGHECDKRNTAYQCQDANPTTDLIHLQADSPCAASNNDCGVPIGALDVGCPEE